VPFSPPPPTPNPPPAPPPPPSPPPGAKTCEDKTGEEKKGCLRQKCDDYSGAEYTDCIAKANAASDLSGYAEEQLGDSISADQDAIVYSTTWDSTMDNPNLISSINAANEDIAGAGSSSSTEAEAGSVITRSIILVPAGQANVGDFTPAALEARTGMKMESGMVITTVSGAAMAEAREGSSSDDATSGGTSGGSGGGGSSSGGSGSPTKSQSNAVVEDAGVSMVVLGVSIGVGGFILLAAAFIVRRYMIATRAPKQDRGSGRHSGSRPSTLEGGSHRRSSDARSTGTKSRRRNSSAGGSAVSSAARVEQVRVAVPEAKKRGLFW